MNLLTHEREQGIEEGEYHDRRRHAQYGRSGRIRW
jgi:hypothetical protein